MKIPMPTPPRGNDRTLIGPSGDATPMPRPPRKRPLGFDLGERLRRDLPRMAPEGCIIRVSKVSRESITLMDGTEWGPARSAGLPLVELLSASDREVVSSATAISWTYRAVVGAAHAAVMEHSGHEHVTGDYPEAVSR